MKPFIDWVAHLPSSWREKPLIAVADYLVSNVDKIPAEGETPVRLCNYTDVYNNEFITPDLDLMITTATENEIEKFRLKVGDIVITKDSEDWNDIGVPAFVKKTADDLVCGYHLAILRPRKKVLDGRFLLRCLQAKALRVQLELAASSGVTRFGIPKAALGLMRLPIPSLSKQREIADYLDQETRRIDSLLAGKERLLAILVEKRRALITSAIIRGLNHRSAVRDSGIPWLGKIPASWQVERARWLFRERDERSTTGEEELLSVSHLTGVTPRSSKDVNMFEAETTEGYKLCYSGDLVINTLWAWMGAMGVSRVNGIVSPAYNVYKPNPRLDPGFVDLLVRIPIFSQEVIRYSKGVWSSRLRLYPEGFFEVYLPVPPIEEQRAIAGYIAGQTTKLDAMRTATERTIALLRERRSALINAAVTGQISIN